MVARFLGMPVAAGGSGGLDVNGPDVDTPVPSHLDPSHLDPPVVINVVWDDRALTLRVFNLALACCAMEFAAAAQRHERRATPAGQATGPAGIVVNVLVVSGTVTDRVAPAIARSYALLTGTTFVVAFGACASSGGPYWDSYSVVDGVDKVIPVDVYVPGCPPRPEALWHGVAALRAKTAGLTR